MQRHESIIVSTQIIKKMHLENSPLIPYYRYIPLTNHKLLLLEIGNTVQEKHRKQISHAL